MQKGSGVPKRTPLPLYPVPLHTPRTRLCLPVRQYVSIHPVQQIIDISTS